MNREMKPNLGIWDPKISIASRRSLCLVLILAWPDRSGRPHQACRLFISFSTQCNTSEYKYAHHLCCVHCLSWSIRPKKYLIGAQTDSTIRRAPSLNNASAGSLLHTIQYFRIQNSIASSLSRNTASFYPHTYIFGHYNPLVRCMT